MDNKKGTYLSWVEVVLFMVFFLGVMAIIGFGMNDAYGKNHDLTFGLNMSSQFSEFQTYRSDAINDSSEGQVSISDFGVLKLLTVPKMVMQLTGILWSFVNGTFLYNLIMNMNLGEYSTIIASVFQVLYVIALLFILIKLVLRINI